MSGHSTYQPQSKVLQWFEKRLPIGGLIHSSFVAYPTPRNLNYLWTFGGILSFMLGVQIITGIVLAMHYTPHVDLAFRSVESIMRDVNFGWLLRYLHANGASMFFLAVYIHMFRGIYYGSYKEPREVLWILGVIIYLLMMATGFMGYVLVWGQMSFWAATVITNLFSAIPGVGETHRHLAVGWLCGRQSDAQSFLFAALPVAVRDRGRGGAAHLGAACCRPEQSDGHRGEVRQRHRSVHALCDRQGRLLSWPCFCILYAWFVFYIPGYFLTRRQLHSRQSGGNSGGNRARMVLPAILRHPAVDPGQTHGRDRAVSRRSWCWPSSPGSIHRACARRVTVRCSNNSSGCG